MHPPLEETPSQRGGSSQNWKDRHASAPPACQKWRGRMRMSIFSHSAVTCRIGRRKWRPLPLTLSPQVINIKSYRGVMGRAVEACQLISTSCNYMMAARLNQKSSGLRANNGPSATRSKGSQIWRAWTLLFSESSNADAPRFEAFLLRRKHACG